MNDIAPYRILLIEDDVIDQMAFKRMVRKQKLNYDFEVAGSVAEAESILAQKDFDLVITDYQLGDGNAFSLFDDLKDTPFIFATGGGDEEIAVKALKAGAYDYLIKDQDRNYLKILPLTIKKAIQSSKTKEQIRLLESAVVNANDAVFIAKYTPEIMYIMYLNEAFSQMTGYDEDEILGQELEFLVGKDSNHDDVLKIRNAVLNFESIKSELILYRKDGSTFWGSYSMVPLLDENQRVTHYVSILRDITERKKVEQELIEAKQAAERARAAEQQFLASMSHEIRTPMNAVIGMTHLLFDTDPSLKQLEYLSALQFSADSLMGIISDILDLSKIEAGHIDFEAKQFNLLEMMLGLQKAFLFKLKEKNIKVVMDLDLAIENDVVGDPTRLNQILTNLLGNASKFTEAGEIGVKMKLVKEENNYYFLEFQAFDSGIGIAPDKIDLVFENFKQADTTITRKYGGTGLGLPIVKSLVELQGGKIWVESELGKGTTFFFTLALKNSGIKSTVKAPEDRAEDTTGNHILEKIEILIAEDNLMNQKLISEIMKKWSCSFDIADNGRIALDKLNNKKYDIVLMDVNMPEMDGYTATKHIRAANGKSYQDIPIVALTAAALSSEREKVFTVGMNEYVTKPFVPAQLKKVILSLVTSNSDFEIEEAIVEDVPEKEEVVETTKEVTYSLDYLNSFSGGDTSFIIEMISIFVNQTPNDSKLMEELLQAKSWTSLGKLAHKMKPNFLMVGMPEQESLSKEIEIMGKSGDVDETAITRMTQQLISAARTAVPMLEKELETLKNGG